MSVILQNISKTLQYQQLKGVFYGNFTGTAIKSSKSVKPNKHLS